MSNAVTSEPARDTHDREFLDGVARFLKGWQEEDRNPRVLHREVDRLSVWTRHDGRVYLTASTGAAVVAVDCTGVDLTAYEPAHPHVARVLEAEAHAPQAVDLPAFWEWLGDATVNGDCLACNRRLGKVFGSPYNLGIIKGALESVDFLDSDTVVDWRRLVEPPPGTFGENYRAARIESGRWIIVCTSRNVRNPIGRFAPEWPRDYEITDNG